MSHFDANLQPVIITNITPGVRAVIEPPQNPEVIKFLKLQHLHILPRTVVLNFGEWHLFLNGYFNEPYSDKAGQTFQLTRNFDVNDFLKSKGLADLRTLQTIILKNAAGFKNGN